MNSQKASIEITNKSILNQEYLKYENCFAS